MSNQIFYDGTDITNFVLSYSRQQQICTSIGNATFVLSLTASITPQTYKEIELWENGVKKGTYVVTDFTKNIPAGTLSFGCQDYSKRIQDYFVSDTYLVIVPTTARFIIEKYLVESGVTYSINTAEDGNLVNNQSVFGLMDAMSIIIQLLQMNGWYMYFDPDNVAQIGHFSFDTVSSDYSVNDTTILNLTDHQDDVLYRNRVLVIGMGDPLDQSWVHGEVILQGAENEYDDNDIRTIVVANQYIDSNAIATSLANKAIEEFTKQTRTVSFDEAGFKVYKIGDRIKVNSSYVSLLGTVTSVGSSSSSTGSLTHVVIGERCPRLFSYYGLTVPPHIPYWEVPFNIKNNSTNLSTSSSTLTFDDTAFSHTTTVFPHLSPGVSGSKFIFYNYKVGSIYYMESYEILTGITKVLALPFMSAFYSLKGYVVIDDTTGVAVVDQTISGTDYLVFYTINWEPTTPICTLSNQYDYDSSNNYVNLIVGVAREITDTTIIDRIVVALGIYKESNDFRGVEDYIVFNNSTKTLDVVHGPESSTDDYFTVFSGKCADIGNGVLGWLTGDTGAGTTRYAFLLNTITLTLVSSAISKTYLNDIANSFICPRYDTKGVYILTTSSSPNFVPQIIYIQSNGITTITPFYTDLHVTPIQICFSKTKVIAIVRDNTTKDTLFRDVTASSDLFTVAGTFGTVTAGSPSLNEVDNDIILSISTVENFDTSMIAEGTLHPDDLNGDIVNLTANNFYLIEVTAGPWYIHSSAYANLSTNYKISYAINLIDNNISWGATQYDSGPNQWLYFPNGRLMGDTGDPNVPPFPHYTSTNGTYNLATNNIQLATFSHNSTTHLSNAIISTVSPFASSIRLAIGGIAAGTILTFHDGNWYTVPRWLGDPGVIISDPANYNPFLYYNVGTGTLDYKISRVPTYIDKIYSYSLDGTPRLIKNLNNINYTQTNTVNWVRLAGPVIEYHYNQKTYVIYATE